MSSRQFRYIAGPCVIEGESSTLAIAARLKEFTSARDVKFIFRANFDKSNRTLLSSYRGPGMAEGLRILQRVREVIDVPVLTDIHDVARVEPVAVRSGRSLNIKKGQFVVPSDMQYVVQKVLDSGIDDIMLTECFYEQ